MKAMLNKVEELENKLDHYESIVVKQETQIDRLTEQRDTLFNLVEGYRKILKEVNRQVTQSG